jgi:membrane-bound lytic murein transglycosylase D
MRRRSLLLALVIVVGAGAVCAGTAAAGSSAKEPFPRYPQLEPNVAFWRDVFAKYSKHEIVFHDPYHLDVVYGVADVSEIDRGSQRSIRAHIAAETRRFANVLKRLSYADPQTEEEKYIKKVLDAHRGGLPDYDVLAERIRSQRGLADELCGTLERAQPWLPEMKHVLAANGVPVDLAALPIVESGFRVVAHSFVGAAGIWQFTHGTGRRYMRIDHVVDERRDPLAATEAAARYLRENYEFLGAWPLAITGYNHGEAGVAAAVRQLDTKDLGVIVENYRGRAFGFASRNFYAEFLAAREILQNAEQYCPGVGNRRDNLERVNIDRYVSFSHLASCAGIDSGTLAELNPALQRDVAAGRLYVPAGYRLWLPAEARTQFQTAYAALPDDAFHDGQRSYYGYHRVRSGQTLSGIAKAYGVSVSALQSCNGIRSSRSLRAGQTLKIPSRGKAPVTVASSSSAQRSPSSSQATYIVHKLARGQTLSHVAARYGVSAAEIQRYNGIKNPRSLRSGQTVKIPRRTPTVAVASFKTHKVGQGQTLSQIAELYRTTVSTLQKTNGISDPKRLRPGQVIQIPM